MKPLLADPDRPWKKAAFTCRDIDQRTLRTERWRYTEWGSPEMAELYDHEKDSGEFRNLATDPAYRDVVQRLQSLLSRAKDGASGLPQDHLFRGLHDYEVIVAIG